MMTDGLGFLTLLCCIALAAIGPVRDASRRAAPRDRMATGPVPRPAVDAGRLRE
jgi:hypothetical protein